jgi:hypothetical protein
MSHPCVCLHLAKFDSSLFGIDLNFRQGASELIHLGSHRITYPKVAKRSSYHSKCQLIRTYRRQV